MRSVITPVLKLGLRSRWALMRVGLRARACDWATAAAFCVRLEGRLSVG